MHKIYYDYLSSIRFMDGDKFIRIIVQFMLNENVIKISIKH